MALSDNPFVGLQLATLQAMQVQWLQVLSDIAGGGISYSFPGRSFTRANLTEVRQTLSLLRTAIEVSTGRGGKTTAQAIVDSQNQFAG